MLMNEGNERSPATTESELVLKRAIGRAVAQLEGAGYDQSDINRLRATLRALMSSAEHWYDVSDLQPYVEILRDFGMSTLSLLVDNLPQYQRFRQLLPENWRDKPELDLDKALAVINEGVPLIWIPRAATVSDLLGSRNYDERTQILVDRHSQIGDCCLTVLQEVSDPELTTLAEFATEAVQALVSGQFRPAQALASNVLDSWVREAVERGAFGSRTGRSVYSQVTRNIHLAANDTLLEWFRETCVLAPLAVALRNYQRPAPPPTTFNRHATAHAVGHAQYTKSNAVISVMLISSVLREAEESAL